MIGLAVAVVWAGYGIASWGWCLVKGYDVPFAAWFSPLHPYEWPPGGQPPFVPKGQVFPGGGGGAPGAASSSTATASPPAGGGQKGGQGRGAPVGTTGSPVKPYG